MFSDKLGQKASAAFELFHSSNLPDPAITVGHNVLLVFS
jgi:hypothetical protein